MQTYFISDLHLTTERPDITEHFCHFLLTKATSATALYILGDLFEYWIGDDAASIVGAEKVLNIMHQASTQLPCYFVAGNRDFLVGEQFHQQTGFKILEDETVIDLYGTPTLILHGDSLCTDDIEHQQFRTTITTNKNWHTMFLSLPIDERVKQAQAARAKSQDHKQSINMEIMDVNTQAVLACFEKHQVSHMIHGHTHRQNTHHYQENNTNKTRLVLGDWNKKDSILTVSPEGYSMTNHAISNKC